MLLQQRRWPLNGLKSFIHHTEGGGVATNTLAIRKTEFKNKAVVQLQPRAHILMQMVRQGPVKTAEYGLKCAEGPCNTNGIERIAATCVQHMSYRLPPNATRPAACSHAHQKQLQRSVDQMKSRTIRQVQRHCTVLPLVA